MSDSKDTRSRRRRTRAKTDGTQTIKAEAGPGAFQKAFQYRRKLEASYGIILRHKERIRTFVRAVLLTGAAALISCVIAGAILLESVETCRYPPYSLDETFTYRIDLKATNLNSVYSRGKRTTIEGAKIRHLFLSQEFGTYEIVANDDPDLTEVRFHVTNRAKDRYFLPRITTLSAEMVIEEREVNGRPLPNETVVDVYLFSNTSNMISGDHSCKRADIVVEVPAACLLDESKLDIKVNKGHIRTLGDVSQANFDTVTLANEIGDIDVQNMQGFRINLNTSEGKIQANNISAHYLFLLSRTDGGTIKASNISLYSGDNKDSCITEYVWKEGFPQIDKYRKEKVVCEKELGKVTIDSRGAENGGYPAIELDRISGGDISQKMRLGHTDVTLKACYDFYGHFNISSIHGKKPITTVIKNLSELEKLLERANSTDEAYGTNTSTAETPPWLEYITRTSTWTYGKISCPKGVAGDMEMTMDIETNTTGDIRFQIIEPRLGWNGPDEL